MTRKLKKENFENKLAIKEDENGNIGVGLLGHVGSEEEYQHELEATLSNTVGFSDPLLCIEALDQTLKAIPGSDHAAKTKLLIRLFSEMEPRDAFEAMIVSRMIAIHYQYMEYMARAVNPEIGVDVRNMNINRAAKLMRLWDEAKEKLDKHRKKTDQKIEVKHYYVNANQAIVGSQMAVGEGK